LKYVKKLMAVLACAALIITGMTANAYAKASMPDYIKVGLRSYYENKSQISIQSKDIKLVRCDDGASSPLINEEVAEFQSSTGFAVRPGISYQVVVPISAGSLEETKNKVQDYISQGYVNAVPGYNNNKWAVTIYGYSSIAAAKADASKLNGVAAAPQQVTILDQGGMPILLITNSDAYFVGTGTVPTIDLGTYEYRGVMEFMQSSDGLLTAVNIVDFEQYLYGVVPSEMPSSYNYEAVKAQACAARTYALYKLSLNSTIGYDICDTTHCQVYLGYTNENAITTKAVNDTKGMAIYYNGNPIESYFFSSSGGYTDDAKNVWGNDLPYLKAVPDENEINCQTWSRTITLSDLDAIINAKGYSIGSATGMRITIDNKTSRVQKLEIIGSNGSKTFTLEDCRTIFGSTGTSLSSRCFTITNGVTESGGGGTPTTTYPALGTFVSSPIDGYKMTDKDNYIIGSDCAVVYSTSSGTKAYGADGKEVDLTKIPELVSVATVTTTSYSTGTTVIRSSGSTIQLSGRGVGHGVGLSQRGANGLAQQGYDYIAILQHYYTGVTVE